MTNVNPRIIVSGDACAVCFNRLEPYDFLIRTQNLTQTGYIQTEMCFDCILKAKKEKIKAILKE